MNLRAVLLDVDGTLLDSNDAHARSWVETLKAFGHDVSFERIRGLIGMGGDLLMATAVGIDDESPEGQAISKRRRELFKSKYMPHLEPFEGTRALVERLKTAGFDLVVATSAQSEEVGGLLERAQVKDLLPERTTASDAEHSKPAPDIVEAALEKSGALATETVMIGDTPYDLEAARKAGVPLIAFRSGGWDDTAFEGAIAVYDGPADLLAHWDASPLARR